MLSQKASLHVTVLLPVKCNEAFWLAGLHIQQISQKLVSVNWFDSVEIQQSGKLCEL